jgi:hypothetical protein
VLNALEKRLSGEGFDSYGQVKQWLEGEFGLKIPYATVYGLVRFRLASKLKRPRPQHVKKTRKAKVTGVNYGSSKRG